MRTAIGRACVGFLGISIVLLVQGCSQKREASHNGAAAPSKEASATLAGKSGTSTGGSATFSEKGGKVTLQLVIRNATPGTHAVHLHETGDCSDPEAKSAGAHWNPGAAAHGQLDHPPSHLGDIGNVEVNDRGEATLTMSTALWSIGGDPKTDILGKAVVVHASPDDFKSQPAGNAGARIACGVIARK